MVCCYGAFALWVHYTQEQEPAPVLLVSDGATCEWLFKGYTPSEWELEWVNGVETLQDKVCANTDPVRSDLWVNKAISSGVFSRFFFENSCTGQGLVQHIEPLAGLTRHPYFCLRGGQYVVDKSHLVVPVALLGAKLLNPAVRYLLFDLGASLFDEGNGGASQQWMVNEYLQAGVRWSGLWAWEMTVYSPTDVWQRIPKDLKPIYHWYNVPVDADTNDPLAYIRAVARPEDYVLLKVDIDNAPIETALMKRLLASRETLSLLDELYFEHHVDVEPMWGHWGRIPNTSLADTYALFTDLRQRGVMAHTWV
jgi:hypothetical protein